MRSLTARSLAVLGPVLALTVWLGGGPVVAASHLSGHAAGAAAARVTRAGVTFQPLTLVNGWKSAGGVIGDPSASNNGGVVYLSGGLDQPSGTNGTFAMLPRADRPGHRLYLPIFTTDGRTGMEGSLYISPQGEMSLFGNTATRNFSSLAGVSFPLTLTTRKLTLLNGWKSAQPVYQAGDPGAGLTPGKTS
jgi:hypothetical protein